jgi:type II secretory pathway pseudopilin PulG
MKKNKGITMISLMVTIVILMILATITMYYGNSAMKEAKLQDLKTNMLLIQAAVKGDLEKYHFETSNLSDANEKEAQKSNYLKGTKLANPQNDLKQEIFDEIKEDYPQIDGNFDYYYLNTSDLMELGIKDVESSNENGHYIVAYSMNSIYPNIVEVINTKGYLGNYTLSRIQAL